MTNHVVSLSHLGQSHDHAACSNDPGLLTGNLAQRLAQVFLMVQRNIGDHANPRLDHIRSIQPSAHSDFKHRQIRPAAREILKRHRRQHLKKTRMPGQVSLAHQSFRGPAHDVMHQSKVIVRNRHSVEPNPLVDPHQMRRRIKPSLQSRGPQNRGQGSGSRSLAIGPRHQHGGKAALRISQSCQEYAHVRQIKLVRRRRGQFMPQRIHLRHCGFVGQNGR